MTDWSGPPVSANYLAFGYTAVQNGVLVLRGWFFDLRRDTTGERAGDRQDATSARSTKPAPARSRTNSPPTSWPCSAASRSLGTHIYFVSNRTGHKEIWAMDSDGKNQRQITHFNSDSIEPAVSPDGTKIAFTS